MSEHELVLLSNVPAWVGDARRVRLECEGCDLTVVATIGPADDADRFVAALREAHRVQMAAAGEAGPR